MQETDPIVIVIPVLNEEEHIGVCISSLLNGLNNSHYQIFVMDGGSSDDTRAIVEELAAHNSLISLVSNPGRLQSAAVNLGAKLAMHTAKFLVRADAHASYPPGFVQMCIDALTVNRATSVVVPMITSGHGPLQRAIAAAQNTRLGNGGAVHRIQADSAFVDHGHHAVFDLNFFLYLDGYDETFAHNEDAEFDIRALRAGGKIWMCKEAAITYYPRDRLTALARQYFYHGFGRARTTRLHRQWPKIRQMLPVCVLIACVISFALAREQLVLLLIPFFYMLICQAWAATAAWRARDPVLMAASFALVTMHLSWATGFLRGLLIEPHKAKQVLPEARRDGFLF